MALAFLAVCRWTLLGSIVQWMIFKFLPTVTHIAVELVLTSIHSVVVDQTLRFPVDAGLNIGWRLL